MPWLILLLPQAQQGLPPHFSLLCGLSESLINLQAVLFTSVILAAQLRKRSVAHWGCESQNYRFQDKTIIHLSLLHILTLLLFRFLVPISHSHNYIRSFLLNVF